MSKILFPSFWLVFLACFLLIVNHPTEGRRASGPQSFNLGRQLLCYIGRSWSATNLAYIGSRYARYGCWCGPGNSKGRTVDSLDRCCRSHDKCFDEISRRSNKGLPALLKTSYRFRCEKRSTTCRGSGLGRRLCECDKAMAACVGPRNRSWKSRHLNPFACIRFRFPG